MAITKGRVMAKTYLRLTTGAAALALLLATGAAEARRAPPPKTTTTTAPAKSAPSSAKHGIGKGDTEIGFFFNYTNLEASSTNSFTLGAVFGQFLRDTVELRITPVINYTDSAGLSSFFFLPRVTVEKLFPNSSPVVPYVGGGIGFTLGVSSGTGFDQTDLGVFVTPVAGLKFFVSERMALEYALSLQYGVDYQCIDSGGFSSCNTGDKSSVDNTLRFDLYF